MTSRSGLIDAFLVKAGWGGARRRPLADDASFRRYERIEAAGGATAVLMDAPPEHEDVRPYLSIARHLVGMGYSAPRILAEDVAQGFLLIEDLGDNTFTRLLVSGVDEESLYALAIDVLIDLHRRPASEALSIDVPPYDDGRLLDEALLLIDWHLPAITGCPLAAEARESYIAAWRSLFPQVHARPQTLVLRDFHVDNLLRVTGRDGLSACGLLDFQDALSGPDAYDVVSLLEDARRDIDEGLADRMLARYYGAFPEMDRGGFDAAYAILGAQRHAKVIGIFTRLCVRDKKPQYLGHIPRVWRLFERSCRHPALSAVRGWFEANVPEGQRRIPQCESA
ncbi:MAG: phosphotransferase [Rhodospirillales bacterium]|nr:phosphotransferase [Rhodospirillales bacterium]MCW8862176.1 phosphotransferase [Rhodospirillales bacterium]MCW8952952.1 phosphotransferase [Rhodospirillales bacterium]MCW8969799.1 phosphotransferase [Rhodospirillales bacterium]MCW9002914.1 phosphotransferase [Rhodospirillales bacterium]